MVCVRTDAHTRGSRFFLVLLSCFQKFSTFLFLLLLCCRYDQTITTPLLLEGGYTILITKLNHRLFSFRRNLFARLRRASRTSPISSVPEGRATLLLLFLTHESNKYLSSFVVTLPVQALPLAVVSITVRSGTFTLVCLVSRSRYLACHSWNGMFLSS